MEDAPEVFFLRADPGVLKYIDRDPANSLEEIQHFIQMLTDNVNNNTGIAWAITLKGDDKMIGSIGLWRLIKEHYRAEVGYVMHPDHYGKGIMHEAMMAIVDYGFNGMHLHSIEANIHPGNLASQRVLERAGFIREAYFRENYYYNGVVSDSAIYSLIAPKEPKNNAPQQ
jgi:ribosomal-protein-alanine N-acetyltransferase